MGTLPIRWTASGDAITYVRTRDSVSNLLAQPTSGAPREADYTFHLGIHTSGAMPGRAKVCANADWVQAIPKTSVRTVADDFVNWFFMVVSFDPCFCGSEARNEPRPLSCRKLRGVLDPAQPVFLFGKIEAACEAVCHSHSVSVGDKRKVAEKDDTTSKQRGAR